MIKLETMRYRWCRWVGLRVHLEGRPRGVHGDPNPYRERMIVNLHHNLARYMGTGAPRDLT